jgi:hypothetical protein
MMGPKSSPFAINVAMPKPRPPSPLSTTVLIFGGADIVQLYKKEQTGV